MSICIYLLLMIRPPPSSPLFPYTTLFRSHPPELPCRHPWRAPGRPRDRSSRHVRATATAMCGCRRSPRSEEHTSELQSPCNLVCRLLLEKKNIHKEQHAISYSTQTDIRNQ